MKLILLFLLACVFSVALSAAPLAPEWCRPTDLCTAPPPICGDSPMFTCNGGGAWYYNGSLSLSSNFMVTGPVIIGGNFQLKDNANITFNSTDNTLLSVQGTADFLSSNGTWTVNVSSADLKAYAAVESSGSNNYNASKRVIFESQVLIPHVNWTIVPNAPLSCHVPYIVNSYPEIIPATVGGMPGYSFQVFFYTKSECWWWGVALGIIAAFFLFLIIAIIAFRTVPALVAWTTPVTYNPADFNAVKQLADSEYDQ